MEMCCYGRKISAEIVSVLVAIFFLTASFALPYAVASTDRLEIASAISPSVIPYGPNVPVSIAASCAAIIAVLVSRRRTNASLRARSIARIVISTINSYELSVVLSIGVVGWASYSIMRFGHVWLALLSLLVVVELWGLVDPKLGSVFGLLKAPTSGMPGAVFEAFRTPGAPLLVSAYTLVFVGTAAAFFMNLGGFIDRQGLLAIMHFFASYALILVGLAAVIRCLAYVFNTSKT